ALPFVIIATSRAIGAPESLVSDFSDTLSERDASILQFYPEDAQEVLDSVIMAYRVGEHPDVLLPSFVCVEGYRLTHTFEPVD
ncbi:MAG: pyruvate ferredoxin oxidoreductase, partial [Gemmatimonadales bacterium]|nr:pyruvate ferredoxin oxidoreductase [Gemmatimonadales bacterium]